MRESFKAFDDIINKNFVVNNFDLDEIEINIQKKFNNINRVVRSPIHKKSFLNPVHSLFS